MKTFIVVLLACMLAVSLQAQTTSGIRNNNGTLEVRSGASLGTLRALTVETGETGDAGEVLMKDTGGTNYVSWGAPATLGAILRLQFPNARPTAANNAMQFGVPDGSNISAVTFVPAIRPIPVAINTASASVSVSTTDNAGYYFNSHGTAATGVTYTLPTAAAGKQFCFANGSGAGGANTGVLTLAVAASGQIMFTDGTLSTATTGTAYSTAAAGSAACVVGMDSTRWMLYVQRGTWAVN